MGDDNIRPLLVIGVLEVMEMVVVVQFQENSVRMDSSTKHPLKVQAVTTVTVPGVSS